MFLGRPPAPQHARFQKSTCAPKQATTNSIGLRQILRNPRLPKETIYERVSLGMQQHGQSLQLVIKFIRGLRCTPSC